MRQKPWTKRKVQIKTAADAQATSSPSWKAKTKLLTAASKTAIRITPPTQTTSSKQQWTVNNAKAVATAREKASKRRRGESVKLHKSQLLFTRQLNKPHVPKRHAEKCVASKRETETCKRQVKKQHSKRISIEQNAVTAHN